jgi:hypothetical protein
MHVCMSVYIRTYAHTHVYEHHFLLPYPSSTDILPHLLHASDGITTDDEETGKLTHLGRFASSLPLDMKLAMLIYHGILLGATLPLLIPLLLIPLLLVPLLLIPLFLVPLLLVPLLLIPLLLVPLLLIPLLLILCSYSASLLSCTYFRLLHTFYSKLLHSLLLLLHFFTYLFLLPTLSSFPCSLSSYLLLLVFFIPCYLTLLFYFYTSVHFLRLPSALMHKSFLHPFHLPPNHPQNII